MVVGSKARYFEEGGLLKAEVSRDEIRQEEEEQGRGVLRLKFNCITTEISEGDGYGLLWRAN